MWTILIFYVIFIIPAYRIKRKSILDNYYEAAFRATSSRLNSSKRYIKKTYYTWSDVLYCFGAAAAPWNIGYVLNWAIKKIVPGDKPPTWL